MKRRISGNCCVISSHIPDEETRHALENSTLLSAAAFLAVERLTVFSSLQTFANMLSKLIFFIYFLTLISFINNIMRAELIEINFFSNDFFEVFLRKHKKFAFNGLLTVSLRIHLV